MAFEPESEQTDEVARRETPKYDGVYLDGMIGDFPVTITVDTGATTTCVSKRVYDQISEHFRPVLMKGSSMEIAMADGKGMIIYGRARFPLMLGSLSLVAILVVADVEDEVLLGSDILLRGPHGPADLILSENAILLEGVRIPVQVETRPRAKVRKATVADHTIIPGMSEAVVDVFIEGASTGPDFTWLIEPRPDLAAEYQLVLAPTLVETGQTCTVMARVMNPTVTPISLKQDMVIGQGEAVTGEVIVLVDSEDDSETKNFSPVRRIGSNPNTPLPHHEAPPKPAEGQVPEHMIGMLEEASRGKTPEQIN